MLHGGGEVQLKKEAGQQQTSASGGAAEPMENWY